MYFLIILMKYRSPVLTLCIFHEFVNFFICTLLLTEWKEGETDIIDIYLIFNFLFSVLEIQGVPNNNKSKSLPSIFSGTVIITN